VPVTKLLLLLAVLAACGTKHDEPRAHQGSAQAASNADTAATAVASPFSVRVPEVSGPGAQPLAAKTPLVTISPSAVTLDGTSLVPVRGAMIADLKPILAAVKALPDRHARVIVAAEAGLPFATVFGVLEAIAKGGLADIALAGSQRGAAMMVPLHIGSDSAADPLGLVLQVTQKKLLLWSLSGQEGTQQSPLYAHPLDGNFAELTAKLADLVTRRFPSARQPAELRIIVMIDPGQSAQVMLDTLAAASGQFPDVALSIGVP
jgi:biopolymer transport protein ExbD